MDDEDEEVGSRAAALSVETLCYQPHLSPARRPLPSGRGRTGRLLSVRVPLRGSASRSQRSDTRALAGAPVARVQFPATKVVSGWCVSRTGGTPVCLFHH